MQAIGKRSCRRPGRAHYVGWYVVAISLVLMLGLAVIPLFTDLSDTEMSIPVSFRVDTGALLPIAPASGIAKADLPDVEGSGTLRFPPPSGTFLATTALLAAMAMAVGLWVLTQLRAVFRTLRDGRPFVPANAARIRWIAVCGDPRRDRQVHRALRRQRLCPLAFRR